MPVSEIIYRIEGKRSRYHVPSGLAFRGMLTFRGTVTWEIPRFIKLEREFLFDVFSAGRALARWRR